MFNLSLSPYVEHATFCIRSHISIPNVVCNACLSYAVECQLHVYIHIYICLCYVLGLVSIAVALESAFVRAHSIRSS